MSEATSTGFVADTDERIPVLLIDDDLEWGELTAELIEQRAGDITVTLAADAAEGRAIIDDDDHPIECVLCDYQLPEENGLEFLEALRETYPDLPFILITGRGSESIAGEATALNATDYLQKEPNPDRIHVLISRIRSHVERYRVQSALKRSRERFAAVFERIPDPTVICRTEDYIVTEVNPAFEDVFGYSAGTIEGESIDDYVLIEGKAEGIDPDPDTEGAIVREVRRRTSDGPRDFLLRAFPIGEGDRGWESCAIYTDITERRRRERQLERERDLRDAIQDILTNASSRDEIEAAYCRKLVETEDCRFVWIGSRAAADGITPRTWAGTGEGYLDAVALDDRADEEGPPAVRAVRTGEIHSVPDIEQVPDTGWRDAALDHGLRSGLAIPITHNDVGYGVLSVYSGIPDGFDGRQDLLVDLTESLAYAIDAVNKRTALTSDQVITVTIRIDAPDRALPALSRKPELERAGGRIEVEEIIPRSDDTHLQFVTVAGIAAGPFCELAEATDTVRTAEAVATAGSEARVQLITDTPAVGSQIAEYGAAVNSIVIEDGVAEVHAEFPARDDLREVVESFEQRFPAATVTRWQGQARSNSDRERRSTTQLDTLTTKQRQALRAAYLGGYFERPRKNSAADLAASLDIARSTFLQHLRVAERKTFAELLE